MGAAIIEVSGDEDKIVFKTPKERYFSLDDMDIMFDSLATIAWKNRINLQESEYFLSKWVKDEHLVQAILSRVIELDCEANEK